MEAFILQFVLLFPVCLGWVAINGDRWFRSACIGGRDASIIPAQLSLLKSSRGGFGGDDKSRKLKERGTTKKKVSGKMKGRLAELTNDPGKDTRAGLQSSGERPQFDRFGLPILTERELFPPIPPETPITAAAFKEYQGEVQITQEALVEILADNLQLNFSALKRCRGGEGIKVRILHRSPPGKFERRIGEIVIDCRVA